MKSTDFVAVSYEKMCEIPRPLPCENCGKDILVKIPQEKYIKFMLGMVYPIFECPHCNERMLLMPEY